MHLQRSGVQRMAGDLGSQGRASGWLWQRCMAGGVQAVQRSRLWYRPDHAAGDARSAWTFSQMPSALLDRNFGR
jgi:hypothetical protein